jgi:hypothetical protein
VGIVDTCEPRGMALDGSCGERRAGRGALRASYGHAGVAGVGVGVVAGGDAVSRATVVLTAPFASHLSTAVARFPL